MRKLVLVGVLTLVAPATAATQTPRWALGGTLFNITYFTEFDRYDVGIPGGGPLIPITLQAAPVVYVGFFPHPQVAVVPGIAFHLVSSGFGEDAVYGLGLDAAVEWHVSGVTGNSAYAAVNFAYLAFDFGRGDADTEIALGAAIGYRWLPFEFLALRAESVFRRYLDFEENQVTAVLKAEVVFN
ncbi:MAG: hypothetical protein GWN99_11885 [Gemmatimonadetes bacterium]|uniref:Outer membrane protein beta-barrel domain-containing protein n=1 Tax=Candidatus Kutchimonas denitrificans TaxID=3056748 RepID=A0AAE4ZA10_9BACT|nr:hypothetical protein [Gemmatimonadota bacterium]NIR75432.1 hypothetical protein [Candidatus Kutchimonas denitrificans]NIS01746.1 hypothetical protein [Gemmatimonadota bacterium]NIT67528.1 hypothetical protein [Gemmatimonadota bacterium]NIU53391.1 hypothetical protein [Gemmatimonadota bacterium]